MERAPSSEVIRGEVARIAGENTRLRESLLRAEVSRLETQEGLEQFDSRLQLLLKTYRSQRAWRVMLLVREWYTVFLRWHKRGWARILVFGPVAFLAYILGAVAAKILRAPTGSSPDRNDLEFPDLGSYLTQSYRQPYTDEPLTPEEIRAVRIRRHLGEVAPPTCYDIIFFPVFHFNFRFQRPQQLATYFARRGHRVFWICPSAYLLPDSATPYRLNQRAANLWEVSLRGENFDFYREVVTPERAGPMLESLARLYEECGIAENCVLVEWPAWRPLALELRRRFGARIAYDCMDDWDTFAEVGTANLEEEQRLAGDCDALFVTAGALACKHAANGREATLVRNGADFDFFSREPKVPIPLEVRHPVLGYFGAIAEWMDLELLLKAAQQRPNYSFVLIGQNHDQDLSRLRAQPNVRWLGQRPYAEMPAYLQQFDVCLIPFRLNEITHATDPVKLYEYFSQGKPVVATAMQELDVFGDLLYLARDHDEFLRKIDLAVAEDDPELRQRRVEFASANTWVERVEAMDQRMRESFPLVSILIVTHDSREFIAPCLDSVLRHTHWGNYEVIVVDNASTDGSPEILAAYAGTHRCIRLFALNTNTGFSGGNNFAARQARGETLILLNADTIVTAGWVERLQRPVRRDPQTGMVVAVTNWAGNEVKINASYHTPEEMRSFAAVRARLCAGQTLELRVAPLFCTLIPRRVWDQLGELDPGYSVGMFEDDDYSLRARRAGYRIVAAEDCFIHHFGQGSFSQLDREYFDRIFEENRRRFEELWGEPWQPHRYRPGIRPADAERRYSPATFFLGNS